MTQIMRIKKSSGILQEFDPMKIIKVLDWACEGTFVDSYDLFRMIKPHLVDGMTTDEIQNIAIKVAADNITKDTPDYQYVASNLAMFGLRKDVYGQFEPFDLLTMIKTNIKEGVYDAELLTSYTEDELNLLNNKIDHSRDFTMTYAGTMQLIEKYLVKNRVTNKIYETPQIAYMAQALALHSIEDAGEERLKHIIDFYEAVSQRKISLPTPIMAGARTPTRQFSSCVVIEAGDSLDSINETAASIVKYVSKRAGIGIAGGAIRAEGSSIGTGEVKHTGVIPFWKHFNSAVKSCVTPTTKVYVKALGVITIDEVEPGMQILTTTDGNTTTYREVLDKWDSVVPVEKQVTLAFKNGAIINCSTDHKIMILVDGEIKRVLPHELKATDVIMAANGDKTNLVWIEQSDLDTRYIDITVEDTESFYALSDSGATGFDDAVLISNCSQGGIRNGAATVYYPVWHLEFENLIVLKNNKGVEDNRIRQLDYGVQFNNLLMDRLVNDDYITLFSPDVAGGELFKAFYEDEAKFKELYESLEKDPTVRKKRIKASDVMTTIVSERANTGRIYMMFVDNANNHTPFEREIDPIKLSNLCVDGEAKVDIISTWDVNNSTEMRLETYKLKDFHNLYHDNPLNKQFFIKSYDIEKKEISWNRVYNAVKTSDAADVVEVTTDGGYKLKTTPDHRFYTTTNGYTSASSLDAGSEQDQLVVTSSLQTATDAVDSVCGQSDMIAVYDLSVEGTHCFFANNILVHNCAEILLPTKPVESLKAGEDKANGEISLCTLSTLVLNNFDHNDQEEINHLSSVVVRALDNLLTYQNYPVEQALDTHNRRSLGIGVTNYAAWLAKNFHKYTQDSMTLKAVHELFERLQYGLISASVELAKEKGPCGFYDRTKYGKGLLPIDWYNKRVDELVKADYVCDWEALREKLLKYGIRNSTLSAQPPTETSSQISNSTNGIEPPRAAVTTKQSKNGVFNQVVPEYEDLGAIYDFAWDMATRGNKGYLSHVAIMQKFIDQSLSANTYYDPRNYPMNKTPMTVMMEDILFSNYYGIKTLYYHNTRDGADGSEEFDCDSCKV